jgi:hypothetical protein
MPSRRRVGSVMTTDVATVGPDTPFKAVAVLLASWNINGTVERESMIPVIVALIRRVDGVVEVRQTLNGQFDDRGVSSVPPGPVGVLSRHKPHN